MLQSKCLGRSIHFTIKMTFEYVASGLADEFTVKWNRAAFDNIKIATHVLNDVSKLELRKEFEMAMALSGRPSIASIDQTLI